MLRLPGGIFAVGSGLTSILPGVSVYTLPIKSNFGKWFYLLKLFFESTGGNVKNLHGVNGIVRHLYCFKILLQSLFAGGFPITEELLTAKITIGLLPD